MRACWAEEDMELLARSGWLETTHRGWDHRINFSPWDSTRRMFLDSSTSSSVRSASVFGSESIGSRTIQRGWEEERGWPASFLRVIPKEWLTQFHPVRPDAWRR